MNKIDTMRFSCLECGFTFDLPVPQVMECEDHLHCPSCGAEFDKLSFIENSDQQSKAWIKTNDGKSYSIRYEDK